MPRRSRTASASGSRPAGRPRDALLLRRLARAVPLASVAVAGLSAWWGVWRAGWIFDDHRALTGSAAMRVGDWWSAAFGPDHQPLSNRPLSALTLALDQTGYGPGPFGPHVTNLLLHLANAALLFAVVRGALRAPNLAGRFAPRRAAAIAAAVAALWVAHPLGADAVAYATQRSTLLFSGCLLVALLAAQRAHASLRPRRWDALAIAAVALGMASKEDMLVAPLLVVGFERAFLVPSWASLRSRRGFHVALAATWLVLAGCVALGPRNPTVGYATTPRVSAWEWLLTQAGVVPHYLRLAAWPSGLRGAYDWGVVRNVASAALPGLGVLALVGLGLAAWRRTPWWGWLAALFFLLLAPTSTVLPIVTEIVAERRAYLPMLLVLAPAVIGAERLLAPRLAPALLVAIAAAATLALGAVTRARVAVYSDERAFWADAYAKRDPDARSFLAGQLLGNHAAMLLQQGRIAEAAPLLDAAVTFEHPTVSVRVQHAISLQERGRHDEALARLRALVAQAPDHADALGTLGTALAFAHQQDRAASGAGDPRLAEAQELLERAVRIDPTRFAYFNTLGFVLQARGLPIEAERAYHRATELSSERTEPFLNRAALLEELGRRDEIPPLLERLLATRPHDAPLRVRLAEFEAWRGDRLAASRYADDALRLDPGNRRAAALLRELAEPAR